MKTRTLLANAFLLGLVPLLTSCLDPTEDGNLVPKTVDGDPSLPRVALNGSLFHAETFGDPAAPVIVLLHGGPGHDYRGYSRLRQPVDGVRLEDHHRLVFWDQRGSGLSRRHEPAEVTKEAYDADLLALLDRYSPGRPVVLLAHSWGGMYASFFIGAHPERVAGAVLMDTGPLTGAIFEELKSGIQEQDFGSEWLNDLVWGQAIVTPDEHARLDYILMLGFLGDGQPRYGMSTTDREPTWRLGAVANKELMRSGMSHGKGVWDFTTGLDRFQKPVLFTGSELNEVIGAELQKRQMKFYPQSQLAIIAGAGHDHHWTHPEETLRPILSYLSAIDF
jgi:proline iminopeptidase